MRFYQKNKKLSYHYNVNILGIEKINIHKQQVRKKLVLYNLILLFEDFMY